MAWPSTIAKLAAKRKERNTSPRERGTAKPVFSRKKKSELTKLKEKLWELTKKQARKTFPVDRCYTCDKYLELPQDRQTGHFIPSSICGAKLRYDLRNLRIQCFRCNINLCGNGSEFYRRMVKEVGQEQVDELFRIKNQEQIKADKQFYLEAIIKLESILNGQQE